MKALGARLLDLAMGGDMAAARVLLVYALGKPTAAPDPDWLDVDQWALTAAAPAKAEVLQVLIDAVRPTLAAAVCEALVATDAKEAFDSGKSRVVDADFARQFSAIRQRKAAKGR